MNCGVPSVRYGRDSGGVSRLCSRLTRRLPILNPSLWPRILSHRPRRPYCLNIPSATTRPCPALDLVALHPSPSQLLEALMDSNFPPPRAFRTPSIPSAARPGAQPTARTGSVVASLDNGADVTIDESSSTGGNGLYGRPALGVPDSVVRELQRRLGVMYTERLEAVQAAELHRSAIRQRHAIMDENPGSVGERSVAVLQRLRDGVSCDLSFQILRLKRLGPVPPSTGADDVAPPYERE